MDNTPVIISTPFIVEPIRYRVYYCTRCGLLREAPAGLPLYCCGAPMDEVENQEAGRRMMEGG